MSEAESKQTTEEIKQMLLGGETTSVEFKIKPPRPGELAERICGMANNRGGGTIFFGVEDETGRLVGFSRPGEFTDTILRAARIVVPAATLKPAEPIVYLIEGVQILAIHIAPNNGTLYQAGNTFWIRKGSYTIAMTSQEIEEHLSTYGSQRWERAVCPRATLQDLDMKLVERYLSHRAERSRRNLRFVSQEDLLVGLEGAEQDSTTGKLRPTNAGMLMFGYDPQLHVPQSEVVCIRYADSRGVGKYIDRKNFTGNLPELIDKTAEFITMHTRVGARIVGFKREDLPEYPLEALREAIVNAIVHRDYSRAGETVRIFYYADRIEIHSPGLLLPGITIDDLTEMKVPSRPRNLLLAQFLRDIPGYMERVGSGIRLMINEMRELKLTAPEFVEQHEFVVIFRNGQAQTPIEVLDSDEETELNPRQLAGLKTIQENGSISSGEYRILTNVGESTALRDLSDMVNRGILITRGKKRALRYYLAS